MIIDGIRWITRTGAPWRGLPDRYGLWRPVISRFYRWRWTGLWDRLFVAVQEKADSVGWVDWTVHFVGDTTVRAHQRAAGAKKGDLEGKA